jgi:hypothetical protein
VVVLITTHAEQEIGKLLEIGCAEHRTIRKRGALSL